MIKLLVILLVFISFGIPLDNLSSRESPLQSFSTDLKTSIINIAKGSYYQWKSPNVWKSLPYTGIPLFLGFHLDEPIDSHLKKNTYSHTLQPLGALGVASSFPIIATIAYFYGKKSRKSRYMTFAKDSFSATYLALIESALMSHIFIHSRPSKTDLSFWETEFRGKSSFPSGHVIPLSVACFAAWDLLDLSHALSFSAVGLGVGLERILSRKHFLSDIIGGIILSYWAYLGVKKIRTNQSQKISSLAINDYRIYPRFDSKVKSLTLSWYF